MVLIAEDLKVLKGVLEVNRRRRRICLNKDSKNNTWNAEAAFQQLDTQLGKEQDSHLTPRSPLPDRKDTYIWWDSGQSVKNPLWREIPHEYSKSIKRALYM